MSDVLVVDRKRGCRCDPVRTKRGWTMQRTCFESDMGGRDRTHNVQCEHGSTAHNASSADLTAAFVEQCKQDGRRTRSGSGRAGTVGTQRDGLTMRRRCAGS